MAMILDPYARTAPLPDRLDTLASRIRLTILARSLSQVILFVSAFVLIAGFLDYRYLFPPLVRAVLLVALVVATIVFWRMKITLPLRPLRTRRGLARMVQNHFPVLGDSILASMEFIAQEDEEVRYGSDELRRYTVERTAKRTEHFDFLELLDTHWLKRSMVLALVSTLGLGAVSQFAPEHFVAGVARLAVPFGNDRWPTRTRLVIVQPSPLPKVLARGEILELTVKLVGVMPERVRVEYLTEGTPIPDQNWPIFLAEGENNPGPVAIRIDTSKLPGKVSFRLVAGDAETPFHEMQLLPPPMLIPIDGKSSPHFRIEPPAYTKLKVVELANSSGVLDMPVGSKVTLTAGVDRPVARVSLLWRPEPNAPLVTLPMLGFAADSTLSGTLSEAMLAEVISGPTMVLSEDGTRFETTFYPRVAGLYSLRYEDASGIAGTRLLEVRLQADPSPTVTLDKPLPREASSVLPDADLNLVGRASDPVYGLRDVFLEYRTSSETTYRRRTLSSVKPATLPAAGMSALWPGSSALIRPAGAETTGDKLMQRVDTRLRLRDYTHEGGRPLKEGDSLFVRLSADDMDDVTTMKPPGRSVEVELKVVSRDTLELDLQKDQSEMRNELLRLRDMMRDAGQKVEAAKKSLEKTGKLTTQDRDGLIQAEQLQNQVRNKLSNPQDGLRGEAAKTRQSIRDNRLPPTNLTRRAETIDNDISRLIDDLLPPTEQALGAARREAEQEPNEKAKPALEKELTRARSGQQQSQQVIQSMIDRLEPWNAAGELRGDARSLAAEMKKNAEASEQNRDTSADKTPEQRAADQQRAITRQEKSTTKARELIDKLTRQANEKEAQTEALNGEAAGLEAEANAAQAEADKLPKGDPGKADLERKAAKLREDARQAKAKAGNAASERDALQAALNDLTDPASREAFAQAQAAEKAAMAKATEGSNKAAEAANAEKLAGAMKESPEKNDLLKKAEKAKKESDKALAEAKEKQEEADRLRKKVKANGGAEALREDLKKAENALKQNDPTAAANAQKNAGDTLERMAGNLRAPVEAPQTANEQLREAGENIDRIAEGQEKLQKKVRDAAKIADPKDRELELEKLSREQKKLKEETQDLAEKLSRKDQNEAAQELRRAADRMENAAEQLQDGRTSDQAQEEILERLDEARDQTDKQQQNTEEELLREKLAKAADAIKAIRDRQAGAIEEMKRIRNKVTESKKWARGEATGFSDIHTTEEAIAVELRGLIEKRFVSLPVFRRMLAGSADAMEAAAKRIKAQNEDILDQIDGVTKWDDEIEKKAAGEIAVLQERALRRLDQLLDALKPDKEMLKQAGPKPKPPAEGMPPMPPMPPMGKPGQADDLPPLAQLKALKTLQVEIAERTKAFDKKYPERKDLPADAVAELQELQKAQKEIAELLQEMTPADPGVIQQ